MSGSQAMNVASAAPLVCSWLQWRGSRGDRAAGLAGGRLAWIAVGWFGAGIVLGIALLGFVVLEGRSHYLAALKLSFNR